MNKSRWASEGNLHFPLKVKEGKSESTVTCNLAAGKEWKAPTMERAIRAARNDLKGMQERAEISSETPKWQTSGEWKAKEKS